MHRSKSWSVGTPAAAVASALLLLPGGVASLDARSVGDDLEWRVETGEPAWTLGSVASEICRAQFSPAAGEDAEAPEYYAFPLVRTKRVPGTGAVTGEAQVHFGTSPFGVKLAEDGSYLYHLELDVRNLPDPGNGEFVAWVTTPNLDRIEGVGTLTDGKAEGMVRWNKFLVVVTLEPERALAQAAATDDNGGGDGAGASARAPGDRWTGPIVLRGMSRSGMMHTMAGHGPYQQENCAAYGY